MKVLFSKPGKSVRLADRRRMVFDFGDGAYYDMKGNAVPAEESFKYSYNDASSNPRGQKLIKKEGIDEILMPESTVEPEFEIDDLFGNYGFKNKDGEFVIEPQYAYADEFICGLAAVNLNRTWYKTRDGRKFYENHFGYIDAYGKTVIPFVYDEAWPFNKYGVAVVEISDDVFLIDTTGKIIPGTGNYSFEHYYDYDDRFFKCTDKANNKRGDCLPVGLYDTKERKVILKPSLDGGIILPMEYEEIRELADRVFVCKKDGICTLVSLDDGDC